MSCQTVPWITVCYRISTAQCNRVIHYIKKKNHYLEAYIITSQLNLVETMSLLLPSPPKSMVMNHCCHKWKKKNKALRFSICQWKSLRSEEILSSESHFLCSPAKLEFTGRCQRKSFRVQLSFPLTPCCPLRYITNIYLQHLSTFIYFRQFRW